MSKSVYPMRRLPNGKPAPGTPWRAAVVVPASRGGGRLTKVFPDKDDADEWAIEKERGYKQGNAIDPAQLKKVKVGDVLLWFRDEVTPHRAGWQWETSRLNSFLCEPFSDLTLDMDVPSALDAYVLRRGKVVKGQTINRDLRLISAAFTTARERKRVICENPVRSVTAAEEDEPLVAILWTVEDLQLFLDALRFDPERPPSSGADWTGWALLLLNLTGLRPKQLFATRLEWIDYEKSDRAIAYPKLTGRAQIVKNGEAHRAPIDDSFEHHIRKLHDYALAAKRDKLFNISYKVVANVFSAVRAKLAKTHPHVAKLIIYGQRHTWTTTNLPLFADMSTLMKHTGRKSEQILRERYYQPKGLGNALDAARAKAAAERAAAAQAAPAAFDQAALMQAAVAAVLAAQRAAAQTGS